MESNFLTMHYTLSEPEKYGMKCDEITLGSYDLNKRTQRTRLITKLLTLKTISRNQLSSTLQKTYDLVKYSLHTELQRLNYTMLEEPLVPSIGIQSQLPILLAEYSFKSEADVINYLTLLKCIPDYFDSLIEFEEQKITEGLFLDEATASELVTYCKEFLAGVNIEGSDLIVRLSGITKFVRVDVTKYNCVFSLLYRVLSFSLAKFVLLPSTDIDCKLVGKG